MTNRPSWIPATVTQVRKVARTIREFTFAPRAGASFPDFTPGAHLGLKLFVDDSTPLERNYSLIDPRLTNGVYRIAVLHEPLSKGGSAYLHHRAAPGSEVEIRAPANLFELTDTAQPIVYIAAGIGITPVLAHLRGFPQEADLRAVHFAAHRPEAMAFESEMKALCGEKLQLYFTRVEGGKRPDLRAIIEANRDAHFYACGPSGLIDDLEKCVAAAGLPKSALHFERFTAADSGSDAVNMPFEVELVSDGVVLNVDREQTILEALEAAGYDPPFSCRAGICRTCAVEVLSGEPDHRDSALDDEEKAAGNVICTCISRAKSSRLKLDL
ncbi:MAG: PDR/VanB family oxidoreductase [Opitutales bacterium]